jgi:hypothetical protein
VESSREIFSEARGSLTAFPGHISHLGWLPNFRGKAGRNREEHQDSGEVFRLNSYTVKITVNFLDRNYLCTLLELVDKKDC